LPKLSAHSFRMDDQYNSSSSTSRGINYFQVLRNHWGIILICFLLVSLTTYAVVGRITKKFESVIEVEIKPKELDLAVRGAANSASIFRTPKNFFPTQVEFIVSEKNLEKVSRDMNLEKHWDMSEKAVVGSLAGMLDVKNKRNTNILKITVRHKYKSEAQAIATSIAESYKALRISRDDNKGADIRKKLVAEVEAEKAAMDEAESHLDAECLRTGISYDPLAAKTVDTSMEESNYSRKSVQYDSVLQSRKTKETILAKINERQGDKAISYILTLSSVPDARLELLRTELKAAEQSKRLKIASGLGKKHPNILLASKKIEDLREELANQLVIARDNLSDELDQVRIQESQLKKEVDAARLAYQKAQQDFTAYTKARVAYERAKAKFEEREEALAQFKTQLNYKTDPIEIIKKATLPDSPSYPNVNLLLGVGAASGLLCGIAIAFVMELMDTSVKTMDDVERFLQIPVLAVIPQGIGLLHKEKGANPDAEAYRILRTNIEFNRRGNNDNAITVVSGGAGEGKSTTLINLAYICAQGGYTTLMIDGDLRRPRLHTYFELDNKVGLTNFLTTECRLEDVVVETHVDNLYFMSSGILPNDAVGVLNSRRMSSLIQEVKTRFDLVFVDSPPILGVSDASVISSEVDHTMIVIQHRKLPRKMLLRVKQAVQNVGGNIIGVVLNNVDVRSDSEYQYYTSYYTYYSPTEVAKSQEKVTSKKKGKEPVAVSDDPY